MYNKFWFFATLRSIQLGIIIREHTKKKLKKKRLLFLKNLNQITLKKFLKPPKKM